MFSTVLLFFAACLISSGARGSFIPSYYHGPPAPLNHDGTVANTPEVQHAIHAHKAALAHEYHILQKQEHLAASQPDLTSPLGHHYGSHYGGDSYQHDGGHYNLNHNQYSTVYHSQPTSYNYNPEAHIPAPLNHDGTVAHTPEYQAIAAHHHAEYEKALHDSKYQTYAPLYNSHSSLGYGHY